MVTQVVDLGGLTKAQLVGWQQKINEGKAKLALVNGRRVSGARAVARRGVAHFELENGAVYVLEMTGGGLKQALFYIYSIRAMFIVGRCLLQ